MYKFLKLNKAIIQIFFLYILFTNSVKSLEKIYKADSLSNYFSGVVALSSKKYDESYNFLKKIDSLGETHSKYSKSFIDTLVNNSKINEAYRYGVLLKKKNSNIYESDIIITSKLIKNGNFDKAYDHIILLNKKNEYSELQNLIYQIIFNWVKIEKLNLNLYEAKKVFQNSSPKYKNINKINSVFLNCYYDSNNLDSKFENLINDPNTDYSRYTFFYVNSLLNKNQFNKANLILDSQLQNNPRNLLLNQLKIDINLKKTHLKNSFDCKNISNIIAELFYITANALSSREIYSISNFYLNLSKYLNQNFLSYNTLLAENFMMIGDYKNAKKIFLLIDSGGEVYSWHSSKQIAFINIQNNEKAKAIKIMQKKFKELNEPTLYQTYDFANFLKNNEKFKQSIIYYSQLIKKISNSHELYPKAKDGRGIAYERVGEWKKAENDFLNSLKAKPNQAYVINYLAYSWIEKGIKIKKSLEMLEQANSIRSNDGYITDSLGWAFYKLKKYKKAEKYLQKAVQLMPSDPIVNDHYADSLWMSGKKIQARYYWNYVLNLAGTEKKLKDKIVKKILNGPNKLN